MAWSELWTVEDARRFLIEVASRRELPKECLSLESLVNRVVAEEVTSPEPVPAFDRSTVDGYALRAEDTFGASEMSPIELEILGRVVTGHPPEVKVGKSSAVRVSTGDMIPQGADAVVMLEHCESVGERRLLITRPVAPGENIAREGEDFCRGDILFAPGHKLRPEDIAALAAVGITSVNVYGKPSVSIISTGNELVPPSASPGPGKIRDSNSYSLMASVKMDGAEPVFVGAVRDDLNELRESLKSAFERDMVVISGGSSVGDRDLVSEAINSLGKPGVVIHGLALKPGKPTIVGLVDSKPIVGLPGHPVSAQVAYLLLVRPAIRSMLRMSERFTHGELVEARLSRSVSSPPGRQEYIRVALERKEGEIWATPILGKSGSISSLVMADGLAVIPLQRDGMESGERVEVLITGPRSPLRRVNVT